MAIDFKKENKELYVPSQTPHIIHIPKMKFVTISGSGDPNTEHGSYQQAIEKLYSVSYALKMSYKGTYKMSGFYEYVVPPLEGFWWQNGIEGVDYTKKERFQWISLIRIPEFVNESDVLWAKDLVETKKHLDVSSIDYQEIDEGLCIQCMHIGLFDDEPKTIEAMDSFTIKNGYHLDFSDTRHHHEIYLSDPRKSNPDKQKTVIRHPITK